MAEQQDQRDGETVRNSSQGPTGDTLSPEAAGQGQGDDLAHRLGGGDASGPELSGAGAASGDMRADRSEATDAAAAPSGSGGPSAGDVGGMGGVHGHTAGSGRPPGGLSPVQPDRDD